MLANQRRSADRGSALERKLAGAATNAVAGDPGERAGEGEVLRTALARLSERDREALMLVAWHELSGARAARAAGCTRAAFAVRLHRARGRLAAQLDSLQSPVVPAVNSKSLEVR